MNRADEQRMAGDEEAKMTNPSYEKGFEDGFEQSLARAVASLNETSASTDEIIGLLQKHWDLPREDAKQRLTWERYDGFFQRDFREYLIAYEGLSEEEAQSYTSSHVNLMTLRKIDKPWTIEHHKLYGLIEKRKPQIKGKVRFRSEFED